MFINRITTGLKLQSWQRQANWIHGKRQLINTIL